MIQRKKSLRDYSRDKKLREGKPLFTPRPATGLKRKGAVGWPSKPQEGSQPVRKPRTGLKRVSSKRAKENREYSERRKDFLSRNRYCWVYPYEAATEVHHKDGREGSLLNHEDLWMPVSRRGHELIHARPNYARERGWLV